MKVVHGRNETYDDEELVTQMLMALTTHQKDIVSSRTGGGKIGFHI